MIGVIVRQSVGFPTNPRTRGAGGNATADYRMVIRTEGGGVVLGVPYAPLGVERSGLAKQWAEVARPAQTPILSDAGEPLESMKFELVIGNQTNASVEDVLARLRQLAETSERLIVSYGPSEAGLWHITEMTQSSVLRDHRDHISRAAISLTFTQVSDATVAVSPLQGGHSSSGSGKIPATHTVKAGDTLHKIATRYYGDPKWWRAIADANKIKHPRKDAKLKVGRKLKLPRKK